MTRIIVVTVVIVAETGELVEQSYYVCTEKPACPLLGLPSLGLDRFFLPTVHHQVRKFP